MLRTTFSYTVLLLFVCSYSCSGQKEKISSEITSATPRAGAAPAEINSVAFNGIEKCWLLMTNGELVRTSNGGKTWEKTLNVKEKRFNNLSFADSERGWAVDSAGGIWRTDDGGESWQQISQVNIDNLGFSGLGRLVFIDRLNGWLVGSPRLVSRTLDGGRSWKDVTPPSEVAYKDFTDFYFIDADRGWLAHSDGIAQTLNGGEVWANSRTPEADIHSVFRINQNTGWISCFPEGGIYRTDDNGRNWKLQLRQDEESRIAVGAIFFLNENEGWAVGRKWDAESNKTAKGLAMLTVDGGNKWSEIVELRNDGIYIKVWFADPAHGWIVSSQNVYRTENGGKTWGAVLSPPTQRYKSF
jgi:photosystem II stability/assembly factor-like uncharacterized protein